MSGVRSCLDNGASEVEPVLLASTFPSQTSMLAAERTRWFRGHLPLVGVGEVPIEDPLVAERLKGQFQGLLLLHPS
jgi:hypothetical protein